MLSSKQECQIYVTNMYDLTEVHERIYSQMIRWLKKTLITPQQNVKYIFLWNLQRFQNSYGKINIKIVNNILQRKDNENAVKLPGIKMYFNTTIIRKIRYKYKDRQTYLFDIINVSEIHTNL